VTTSGTQNIFSELLNVMTEGNIPLKQTCTATGKNNCMLEKTAMTETN
jgi:hypothetical protein